MKEKHKQMVDRIIEASTIEDLQTIREAIEGDEAYHEDVFLCLVLCLVIFQQMNIRLNDIDERLKKLEEAHKET